MQILVILGIAAVCLGAASVYIALRPGLGKIQDGLNALVAFGRDQAEIRFIHHRRGRDIIFRREIIGGVPQILLVTQGLKLAALGIGVGLIGAFALTRLMSGVLVGVNAVDPVTFFASSFFFIVVALLASYFPARRAAAVNPNVALKCE